MSEQRKEEQADGSAEQRSRMQRFGDFMLRPRVLWPLAVLTGFVPGVDAPETISVARPDVDINYNNITITVMAQTAFAVAGFVTGVMRERMATATPPAAPLPPDQPSGAAF